MFLKAYILKQNIMELWVDGMSHLQKICVLQRCIVGSHWKELQPIFEKILANYIFIFTNCLWICRSIYQYKYDNWGKKSLLQPYFKKFLKWFLIWDKACLLLKCFVFIYLYLFLCIYIYNTQLHKPIHENKYK